MAIMCLHYFAAIAGTQVAIRDVKYIVMFFWQALINLHKPFTDLLAQGCSAQRL